MFSGQIDFSSGTELTFCQQFHCQVRQVREDFVLRGLSIEDAPELFALTDANRTRLRQWLPWVDNNTAIAHSQQFIQTVQARAEANQGFVTAICYKRAIAGLVDIHGINWRNRSTSIGYWLGQTYEGKGLMTTACRVVINYAFINLNLHRVEILCATQNTRSCAIPQRLGFTREGTLREVECLNGRFVDHAIYSILKREWPITPSP